MKYEITLILSPKLGDEEAKKKAKEIEKKLAGLEAKVLESNFLGKKDLAYKIKHFEQGYYFVVKMEVEESGINKIRNELKKDVEVIRILVIMQKKDVAEKVEVRKEEVIRKEKFGVEKNLEKSIKKESSKEDLDKKIDKILEEEII